MTTQLTSRAIAGIEIEVTLQAIAKLFVQRLHDEADRARRAKKGEAAKEKKARRLAGATLLAVADNAVEISGDLDRFEAFLRRHDEATWNNAHHSAFIGDVAQDCLKLLQRLKTLRRLVLSYPGEVSKRAEKIRWDAHA